MNRSAVIQAAFDALRALGDDPTRRAMEDMVRRITGGRGFRAIEIAAWLKPLGNQTGTNPEPRQEPNFVLVSAVSEPAREPLSRDAGADRKGVSNVVSLVSQDSKSPTEISAEPKTVSEPRKKPRGKREPSPEDIAAWRFLDATMKAILAHHGAIPMTQLDWKRRNKRPATEMLASGFTVEDALERLNHAFTDPGASKYFGHIDTLWALQKHWAKLEPREGEPNTSDLLPTRLELENPDEFPEDPQTREKLPWDTLPPALAVIVARG